MKNYKTLARLFHADPSTSSFAHLKERTLARLEADSTFRTGIQTSLGEFFVANPRELILLSEKVLLTEKTVTQLWDSASGVIQWNYIRHAISEDRFVFAHLSNILTLLTVRFNTTWFSPTQVPTAHENFHISEHTLPCWFTSGD